MISNVCPKRAGLLTAQACKGLVDSSCLSESESNVDNGLDEYLPEGQPTATQM